MLLIYFTFSNSNSEVLHCICGSILATKYQFTGDTFRFVTRSVLVVQEPDQAGVSEVRLR